MRFDKSSAGVALGGTPSVAGVALLVDSTPTRDPPRPRRQSVLTIGWADGHESVYDGGYLRWISPLCPVPGAQSGRSGASRLERVSRGSRAARRRGRLVRARGSTSAIDTTRGSTRSTGCARSARAPSETTSTRWDARRTPDGAPGPAPACALARRGERGPFAALLRPVASDRASAVTRTWVPAMVPWRATEDGYVTRRATSTGTAASRTADPASLVVEATGIRDVPSGPLLRIGHDRFVAGPRAPRRRAVREASARARRASSSSSSTSSRSAGGPEPETRSSRRFLVRRPSAPRRRLARGDRRSRAGVGADEADVRASAR